MFELLILAVVNDSSALTWRHTFPQFRLRMMFAKGWGNKEKFHGRRNFSAVVRPAAAKFRYGQLNTSDPERSLRLTDVPAGASYLILNDVFFPSDIVHIWSLTFTPREVTIIKYTCKAAELCN